MPKQSINKLRMGSYFRKKLLEYQGIKSLENDRILDVGCYDGYWLSTQRAKEKIGLDIDISKSYKGIKYIQSSALKMPLATGYFDKVFAFDVIEHIPAGSEDKFLKELVRVTKNGGEVVFSCPARQIEIFPAFLTTNISLKWGHNKYPGLGKSELKKYLEKIRGIKYEIKDWNTRGYLRFYLGCRLFWSINMNWGKTMLNKIAKWDSLHLDGEKGFFLVTIKKL